MGKDPNSVEKPVEDTPPLPKKEEKEIISSHEDLINKPEFYEKYNLIDLLES